MRLALVAAGLALAACTINAPNYVEDDDDTPGPPDASPTDGGPPSVSSQPHHQLALERCEWRISALKRRAALLRRGTASRFPLPPMRRRSNGMLAASISTLALLWLETQWLMS